MDTLHFQHANAGCTDYNDKCYMTTAYEISTLFNHFGIVAAVFSVGQGSTDIPSGWTCISDMILKCHHKLCKGCTITDPAQLIMVKSNADMFVDDNKLMHSNQKLSIPTIELMKNIQLG
eukprot:7515247-Ditylum_brightwellii.AAC.1